MSLEDTVASPVTEPTEAPAVTEAAPDANPAESSNADTTDAKQAEPENLESALRRVVEPTEAPAEEPSTPEAQTEEQAETEATAEEDADPDADVPFHKHPRWQEMKAERDSFRQEAEAYRSMQDFMTTSNLTGEEVAQGFDVMALIKSATLGDLDSAAKAREWFAERLNVFDEMLGLQLPEDLRQKVEDGLVDEDIAKELAATRARAANYETVRTRETEQQRQAREAEAAQARQVEISNAVTAWETGIAAKDPDYATKKAGLVETQVRALIQQSGVVPRTPEEARDLAQKAYDSVNETLRSLIPKPKPMAPSPTGMSAKVTTAPASFADAVRAAVNR